MLMHRRISLSGLWRGRPACTAHVLHHRARHTACPATKAVELGWVPQEHRDDVKKIIDMAERASQSWQLSKTGFLSPALVMDAMAALSTVDVKAVPVGGFSQAERCRLLLGREEAFAAEGLDDPPSLAAAAGVGAISITGNFLFDAAAHPDFLGALLGTGVVREKVGDIIVLGERGAQAIVDVEMVEHFESALERVRTVPVTVKAIPISSVDALPARVSEMTSLEASLRLDAVASAGFRVSRSKMADWIKAGKVRVNWREAAKTSVDVKAGDLVSCTGKGRLEIVSVASTKKGKFSVSMRRFL